jgi:hypothetical protein
MNHDVTNPVTLEPTTEFNIILKSLADLVISKVSSCKSIGVNGKAGVILFLFHYARYSNDPYYQQQVKTLLETVADSIDLNSPGTYGSGVAGFSCVLLFLAKENLVTLDVEEYFPDIDKLLGFFVDTNSYVYLNSLAGTTGIGRHFAERIKQANDPSTPSYLFNKKILDNIIDLLVCPYDCYADILHAVDILSMAGEVTAEGTQIKDYLAYAADRLDTMRCEDVYFLKYRTGFNYARFSLAFSRAASLLKLPRYAALANDLLEKDIGYNAILKNEGTALTDITMADVILYNTIACQRNDRDVKDYCLSVLSTNTAPLPPGLINGYAAMGMSLMYNIGVISDAWLQLIPVVY